LEIFMNIKTLVLGTALAAIIPSTLYAQGIVRGTDEGIRAGNDAAGPVGGVVGGLVGGVAGGIGGLLGVDDRPRFREYVVREHRPSVVYHREVVVGTVLPDDGITYYDVPADYGRAHGYKYAVLNDRTVLVDPHTRKVIEIVE
jgi:hypothetical protein